jgi:nucleoside 2-deoxyribosyltransferase
VFFALEVEGWSDSIQSFTEVAARDYHELARADAVVALYPTGGPSSVLIELGWAAALHKPVLLMVERRAALVPLARGLEAVTLVRTATFERSLGFV